MFKPGHVTRRRALQVAAATTALPLVRIRTAERRRQTEYRLLGSLGARRHR